MGITEGNTTDDLQGSWKIDHQIRRRPNIHDTNYRKIQYTQNEALRIATGCHSQDVRCRAPTHRSRDAERLFTFFRIILSMTEYIVLASHLCNHVLYMSMIIIFMMS